MGAPRKVAATILSAMLRLAPEQSRDWATAMLRELDFIEGDWAALYWALGSAAAILRHAARLWRMGLNRKANQESEMNNTGKKALGVGMGLLSTLGLVGCVVAGLRILELLFPGLGLQHSAWAYWLAVLAIPEAVFVGATILLWRRKGPVAAGILAISLMIALHVAVHMAMR